SCPFNSSSLPIISLWMFLILAVKLSYFQELTILAVYNLLNYSFTKLIKREKKKSKR
ncbi:unnamed protein product, partial [Arabidopsis halleri]